MPPLRVRLIGRTLSFLVARAPWLWPLLRSPTTRFWDGMAAHWTQRTTTPGRMYPLEAALEHVGSPRRILEIGTGAGDGAQLIAARFPDAELTAVDISERMLAIARDALPERVRLVRAEAAALPFDAGSFDLVVQMNVPVYFRELARVTAPGGCVAIASSLGPVTPYYTPHGVLRRRFTEVASGQAAPGDYFIGRPS